MCQSVTHSDAFKEMRLAWIDEGYDYILIRENTGRIEMGVVMNFDVVEQFDLIESA